MQSKFKSLIKSMLPPSISMYLKIFLKKIRGINDIEQNVHNLFKSINEKKTEKISQKELLRSKEFKLYSQNGEDGILQYIFSVIGVKNKTSVEFGIEDGRECNTANLIINEGWNGILMDGGKKEIREATYYYRKMLDVPASRVKIRKHFITKNNINHILEQNGLSGEIDLLSIDIDGNDYWIWEKIEVISPRVVVIEYNSSLGIDKSITVKYDPSFNRMNFHPWYHGASLDSLVKLGKVKGYVLIGCDSSGVNAFFIKKELQKNKLKEMNIKEVFYPQYRRLKEVSQEKQFDKIKKFRFEKV